MPCRDGRDEGTRIEYREDPEMERRRHKLARMLCTVLGTLSASAIVALPSEIREWWDNHRKEDKERERKEKERRTIAAEKRRALARLTPRERKLLNL